MDKNNLLEYVKLFFKKGLTFNTKFECCMSQRYSLADMIFNHQSIHFNTHTDSVKMSDLYSLWDPTIDWITYNIVIARTYKYVELRQNMYRKIINIFFISDITGVICGYAFQKGKRNIY